MGRRLPQTVPGLLFHSVLPHPAFEMSHFPLSRFTPLLESLKKRQYQAITLQSAAVAAATELKPLLLTFDDGLNTVYHHALPALQDAGMVATIFCVSGYLGNRSGWDVFNRNIHLTSDELREIAALGHEIGSHTHSHVNLPYLDTHAITEELQLSKRTLEDIIGREVTSLSFPHGGWSPKIWNIAQEIGYKAATLYRGRRHASQKLFPVQGVYQFDSIEDILVKIDPVCRFSSSRARAVMMSHFAKGTPIWKYRREYSRV